MRRALLVFGIFAMVGCGISAVATRDGAGPSETADAAPNPNLPDTSTQADATVPEDAALDADSSVPTFPSHINAADYTLETNALTITEETTIDTDDMSVKINGSSSMKVLEPGTQGSDPIAVWSVGPLTLSGANGNLTVSGKKALVIVVNGDLTSSTTIRAAAGDPNDSELDIPGPGGTTSGVAGASVGGPGQTGAGAAGGGGGGHASAGGRGGNQNGSGGGKPGTATTSTALLGGRGGGNGGGFASSSACARGGNGGGAIQLSVTGKITFLAGSIIDVSGGGGHGGCKANGGTAASAGGGGGAGGLIYLEALGDISLPGLTAVVASGGAGGEGGDSNDDGKPGDTPDFYHPTAFGGSTGGSGGNGGNGAMSNGTAPGLPLQGTDTNAASGGGGGAAGRVFFRTRPPAVVTMGGFVYAYSKTESF